VLASLLLAGGGELWLPAVLSDHMVLQRETRVTLWGRAAPLEALEIRAGWDPTRALEVEADGAGTWRVELATPAAGGPYELAIHGAEGSLFLRDVLVGEVWLAAGQSNMEWTLGPVVGSGVEGWEEALASAPDEGLRVLDVANDARLGPSPDCQGAWKVATRESARGFSATAYFFARELRRALGVPVGVITADWGGTPCEAWMSAEMLAPFPEFEARLEGLRAWLRNPRAAAAAQEARVGAWWEALASLDAVDGERCSKPDHDERGWSAVSLPATWEQHGLSEFDGVAWYRRALELPAAWAGQELVLRLGPIDDRDTLWWNGARIGGHEETGEWQTPRVYRIPSALVRAGANALAVRVLDTGGLGGFAGTAEDLRLHPAGAESAALSLAGRWSWRASVPLASLGWPPSRQDFDQNTPSVLWNGMIAPLAPFAVRGAIWYQGEANRERAEQYRTLFPALITGWRAAFARGPFPFYFVQLAPFAYAGDAGEAARLRDAQREALALPATGMAVTMDVGDPADIHPVKKREVGERLALWALARTYGRELECSGPLYRAQRVEGGAIRIEFEHARGLTARGAPVRHATIAGSDRVFHPAEARIEGESLRVSSPAVPAPVAVRFGWGAADETNLWNAAGLPAASFRTDDWP
jgi:sialate O-acetylesterase